MFAKESAPLSTERTRTTPAPTLSSFFLFFLSFSSFLLRPLLLCSICPPHSHITVFAAVLIIVAAVRRESTNFNTENDAKKRQLKQRERRATYTLLGVFVVVVVEEMAEGFS